MPKNRQHYRKIKYPDKVTKQNALYLSGYFYLVLWEVEMLISRQPLPKFLLISFNFLVLLFAPPTTAEIPQTTLEIAPATISP